MESRSTSLLGTPRDWAIDLAFSAAAGAFLGVIGPFGSFFNGPVAARVIYWVLTMWCATVVLGVISRLAVALAMRFRIPVAVALGAGLVVASVPLSLLIAKIAATFWPRVSLTPLDWYWQCLVISAPFVAIYAVVHIYRARGQGSVSRLVAQDVSVEAPSLAPPLDEVLCLRMEDHYVRIHSAVGSRLVAGPFERVIASLGQREGMRVHRSWWVARSAVVGVRADGRNLKLELSNGLQAPVSRASVAKLRQVGWLPSET